MNLTVLLTDMERKAAVEKRLEELFCQGRNVFQNPSPTVTFLSAAALPKQGQIELAAVAVTGFTTVGHILQCS